MNTNELEKFLNGKWCNLQLLILDYKTEKERIERLDELDSVNYRGATLGKEVRYFNVGEKSLNDSKKGIPVVLSSWEMKKA